MLAAEAIGVKCNFPFLQSRRSWHWLDSALLLLVFLSAALVFLPALGSAGIIDSSEGYYAEGAREMVESGDYITPHLNYAPWYEKPVLTYWLMAASYKVFGVSEFAARFPAALSGILLTGFIFSLSRVFLSRRAAFLAAMVLISQPLFVVVGHLSLTDMPFTLFVTVALGGLFSTVSGGPSFYLPLAYVALGLSLLSKGPLGLVIVLMVFDAYLLWTC